MSARKQVAGSPVRGRIVMAVLHQEVRSPLPKIAPLLIGALEKSGWAVVTTFWGGRGPKEGWTTKILSRSRDLVLALATLAVHKDAVLFVNSSHSPRAIVRDVPLVLGAKALGRASLVLWHGSRSALVAGRPHALFTVGTGLLCRSADAVLVLSSAELEACQRIFPRGRYVLVANPYESKMPAPDWTSETCSILFVGRLMQEKGIYELLDAFAGLRTAQDWRLILVGDGPEGSAVADWIAAHGLSTRVEMPGYLDEPALRRQYMDASIFVLPSYSEGFPTAISEAMDAGLPVVTTRCGGMADHLDEGVNCLFVKARDAGDLERVLARLVDDPELRKSMGNANRRKVQGFAPDVVVGPYLRALEAARARKESE